MPMGNSSPPRHSGRWIPAALLLAVLVTAGTVWLLTSYFHRPASTGVTVRRPPRGTLRLAFNTGASGFVRTLDPALAVDPISSYNIELIHAGLVKLSYPSLTVIPDLAAWTVSSSRTVYTFTIRPGARFNNGDAVTAADVKWSLTRALLPPTGSSTAVTYLGSISGAGEVALGKSRALAGVTVLNSRQLRITLTQPYVYFLTALASPVSSILDVRVMPAGTSGPYFTNTCGANVGAGPFMLSCNPSGTGRSSFFRAGAAPAFIYRPNPYYVGPRPALRLIAPLIATADVAWTMYRAGRLDSSPVPVSRATAARRTPGYSAGTSLQVDFITPNQTQPPFSNVNCRLAIAYGLDRTRLSQAVLRGSEEPMSGVVPPGLPQGGQGFIADPRRSGVPIYDPVVARGYLSRCPGQLRGAVLTYGDSGPMAGLEYREIRRQLVDLGADIRLNRLSFQAWVNAIVRNLARTRTQLIGNVWIGNYPDAQDWLQNLLSSTGNYNIGGFHNGQFDNLVARGNVEADPARRAQLYHQAQVIALRAGAWIAIGYSTPAMVIDPTVRNFVNVNGNLYPIGGNWSAVRIKG